MILRVFGEERGLRGHARWPPCGIRFPPRQEWVTINISSAFNQARDDAGSVEVKTLSPDLVVRTRKVIAHLEIV